MNCYKCGKEMRVVPEQVATDEKGLPIYHRIGYCDACQSKFDIDVLEQQQKQSVQNNQKPPKKKQSKLSIVSAILTILGITIPVAIVLAIIDLVKGDKENEKHGGSWFAIIFSVLVIISYAAGASDDNSSNGANNSNVQSSVSEPIQSVKPVEETATVEQVESVETTPTEQPVVETNTVISPGYTFDADGLQVTINDFDLDFTDYDNQYGWNTPADGTKYITIEVSYQNNSKSDKYISIYDFECYADNADCEQNYSVVDNSSVNANISSGRTGSYTIAFVVPQDAQSIELEYETSIWTGHKEVIKLQ